MKLEITIATEDGIILEQVLADTADLPHPENASDSAVMILQHIERIVDCKNA